MVSRLISLLKDGLGNFNLNNCEGCEQRADLLSEVLRPGHKKGQRGGAKTALLQDKDTSGEDPEGNRVCVNVLLMPSLSMCVPII